MSTFGRKPTNLPVWSTRQDSFSEITVYCSPVTGTLGNGSPMVTVVLGVRVVERKTLDRLLS